MKTMLKIFNVIIMFSSLNLTQELNWKHLNGPMGGTVQGLEINSKGEIFAGVAPWLWGNVGLYKSTNNGDSWNKIETQYFDFPVYSIYITKNDHIWVGTDHVDRIYLSTDNGETWVTKNNGYFTNECWAFGESNDGVLFAGDGQYNKIFRSTNYGGDWELSTELSPYVFATDSNNIVYTGTATGLYSSTDNGLTWKQDDFLNNVAVSSILIDEKNNLYCGTGYYSNGDGVFFSSDGGENWTLLGLTGKVVLSLAFDSQKNLFAGSQLDGLYKTSDMGQTWIQYQSGLYRQQIFRTKINSDDDIFVGGEGEPSVHADGGIFRSIDGGNSFKQVGLPVSNIKNVIFSGDSLVIASTPSGVQKYDRYTKKWENLGLYKVEAVTISPNNILYVATYDEGIFKSADFGKSWSNLNVAGDTVISSYNILSINEDTIFVSSSLYNVRRTLDGGDNWEILNLRSGYYSRGLFYLNNDLWATGNVVQGPFSLYRSSDLGTNFVPVVSNFGGANPANSPFIVTNDGYIFLVSLELPYGILKSTDGGVSWEQVLFDVRSRTVFAKDNGLVLTGSVLIGLEPTKIYLSKDFGENWSSYDQPTNWHVSVTDIKEDINGKFFFATSAEGLFEVDIVTSVEEPNNIHPNNFMLYQNYPNPINPTTTIEYSLKERTNIKLTVFNIMGEEIKTLINEEKIAGHYSITFNGINLPSGVYFYELLTGNTRLIKKMILLR